MASEKFDNEETLALQALGFRIGPENSYAQIQRGSDVADDVRLDIMRVEGSEQFCVQVTLPNGSELVCFTTRQAILQAVQRAAVEDNNEAAKLATSELRGSG